MKSKAVSQRRANTWLRSVGALHDINCMRFHHMLFKQDKQMYNSLMQCAASLFIFKRERKKKTLQKYFRNIYPRQHMAKQGDCFTPALQLFKSPSAACAPVLDPSLRSFIPRDSSRRSQTADSMRGRARGWNTCKESPLTRQTSLPEMRSGAKSNIPPSRSHCLPPDMCGSAPAYVGHVLVRDGNAKQTPAFFFYYYYLYSIFFPPFFPPPD